MAMLNHRPNEIERVLLSSNRNDKRLQTIELLARQNTISCKRVPLNILVEHAEANRHQGVVVFCHHSIKKKSGPNVLDWLGRIGEGSFIVALDGIIDPRNLGACIRSANAAGVNGVIVPRSRGSAINATVSRTAVGAAEMTPIFSASNLARTLEILKDKEYFVLGLDATAAKSVYETSLTEKCVLVFGAEDSGLRKETRKKCDILINIPMLGKIESVNVSVAVGVVAFEVARQRLYQ